ncbi:MAG: hypothetical protein KatS3mg038_3995 [Candidatus Kapaibacterium sp.]|nr:MAG: hypothetical protein KatS3mg038_3995 [Candidatus Kapabacteria bacterium]
MSDRVRIYLPHPEWLFPLHRKELPYRTLRLELRLSVYHEAIKTMVCAIAGDVASHEHCSLLLQQTLRHVSYYFGCDNPLNATSWRPLLDAVQTEKAWTSDAVHDYIWQKLTLDYEPGVEELSKQILGRITEEDWKSVRDDYTGKDAIVTIDELMALPTNIPPPTIALDFDAKSKHVETDTERVESVQYFYRCLSPCYLRAIASRIATDVVRSFGSNARGAKSLLAASILYVKEIAALPSVRRAWLPSALQPFYALKTTDKVRRNHCENSKKTAQPNMAMVTAILAQITAGRHF